MCCGGHGSGMTVVLLGEFVLVGKHPVATINVTPGERLWCLLDESLTHLWLVGTRRVKPGFR